MPARRLSNINSMWHLVVARKNADEKEITCEGAEEGLGCDTSVSLVLFSDSSTRTYLEIVCDLKMF